MTDPAKVVQFANRPATLAQIRGTVATLRYWRKFLRSDKVYARHPDDKFSRQLTKREARAELTKLIHFAINRKAGIPDVACRKQSHDWQAAQYRDCARVRNARRHRIIFRMRDLETRACLRRFAHLATDYPEAIGPDFSRLGLTVKDFRDVLRSIPQCRS